MEQTRTADDELAFTSALEQARLIRTREVSPVELVDLYLARIEALNPELNAYITVVPEQARQAAARAAEAGTRFSDLPPFHGVPISVKDLHDTAGIRTTQGVAGWSNRVPTSDAECVHRLRGAGFVILGKTTTPELGLGVVSEPVGYPGARNPWNHEFSPGGSSGGAAAALAAGLCAISHGSDGGGSIRIPSAWTGLFGIKPARGRVSAAPLPQNLYSIQGPIARTVADGAALLDVMAGYATGDAYWAPPPSRPFLDEVGADSGPLRVAFTAQHPGAEVDPEWADAAREVARLLEALGHNVVEDAPAWSEISLDHPVIRAAAATMAANAPNLPSFETLDPSTQAFIEHGQGASASEVIAWQQAAAIEARAIVGFFDRYDLLVTPTTASRAPRIGELKDAEDPWRGILTSLQRCPFTADWNLTGLPAASLPMSIDGDGMPIGVQLVAGPAQEVTIIRVASQLEQVRPWVGRRPSQ
jgi:amidase